MLSKEPPKYRETYDQSDAMTIPDEFDIIVCGGGSCGCVVAGRLANLDHNLKVLLIEAGENNLNNPWYAADARADHTCHELTV